ncbi:hypothetical protein Tco_0884194 [Tanacetum coccineum]
MIPGTDLHQFDVNNDGYFAHLPLNYVDGVILEMAVPRMPYEQLAVLLEEKCGCYFQRPPKKRYCNDFFVDEMVDWAEMEVETEGVEARTSTTEGVEARTSTTDKEKEKVSEDATEGAEMEVETEGVGMVHESYVPAWFETNMYFVAYHNYVKPVPGMNFWPDQSMYSTVLPPKPRKMPGRPKKKRIRAIGKGGSSTRISKLGSQGSCSNCKKPGHNKSSCKEPVVEQTPKPKGVPGMKGLVGLEEVPHDLEVDEVSRGGASGSRGGASVSREVGGSIRGSSVPGGASGSRGRGADGSGGASGSRGRGAGGSGGASGSRGRGADGLKRKPVSTVETQKRQDKKKVGTSGFAKWFGLQDELEQTQDEPQQTQHEPAVTQDEDQVEQTEDQVEIKLTQLEQT